MYRPSVSTVFHASALIASLATIGYVAIDAREPASFAYQTGPVGITVGTDRIVVADPIMKPNSTYDLTTRFTPSGREFSTGDIARPSSPSMIRCSDLTAGNRCRGGRPISFEDRTE
ncbi:MAG: hypothetical protein MRY63_04960 [Neomegalonema sp.]|nr:hypothetical protein [Neomegalonema sp.]